MAYMYLSTALPWSYKLTPHMQTLSFPTPYSNLGTMAVFGGNVTMGLWSIWCGHLRGAEGHGRN